MSLRPEADSHLAAHLDASFVGRIIEIDDAESSFSISGPVAEIHHTEDATVIVVSVPSAESTDGEVRPSVSLRFTRTDMVLIRR